MAVDTKPNLSSEKFEQYSNEILYLSGTTGIYGALKIFSGGSFCLEENAGYGKVLVSDNYGKARWENIGGFSGSNEKVERTICLPFHGFSVGNVVGFSGNTYNLAIADGTYDGEILGVVSCVINDDSFKLIQSGYITGLTGLYVGCTYFLSDTNAGIITPISPSSEGHINKSVLIADSSSSGWVLPYAGYVITTGNTNIGLTCGINGLSSDGTTVCLGGDLTRDTQINGGGNYSLCLGSDASLLSNFKILAGSSITIEIPTNSSLNLCGNFVSFGISSGGGLLFDNNINYAILYYGGEYNSIGFCGNVSSPDMIFNIGSSIQNAIITDNRFGKKGFEYANDYSETFTTRSLVDKGYVDSKLTEKLDKSIFSEFSGRTHADFDSLQWNISGHIGTNNTIAAFDSSGNATYISPDLFSLSSHTHSYYAKCCSLLIQGNNSSTGFLLEHNLNKQFPVVQVIEANSPYATIYTDVLRINSNCICVCFATAPPTGTNYCVVIIG